MRLIYSKREVRNTEYGGYLTRIHQTEINISAISSPLEVDKFNPIATLAYLFSNLNLLFR